MKNFKILNIVAKLLKMTAEDINAFAEEFNKQQTNSKATPETLISTPLQLAYLKGNKMSFLNGLDLNRREELWGIRLTNGVCLSLLDDQKNWHQAMETARRLRHGLWSGSLPRKGFLMKTMSQEEEVLYNKTVQTLKDKGIDALGYQGSIICLDKWGDNHAYRYNPRCMSTSWLPQSLTGRVAVIF